MITLLICAQLVKLIWIGIKCEGRYKRHPACLRRSVIVTRLRCAGVHEVWCSLMKCAKFFRFRILAMGRQQGRVSHGIVLLYLSLILGFLLSESSLCKFSCSVL